MRVAEFAKSMLLGSLDVIVKTAVAIAGAYGGLLLLIGALLALPADNELLRDIARRFNDGGIPIGGGVLPWFSLIWLGTAIAGAVFSLWVWRRILRSVFRLFGRRLTDE